MEPRRVRSLAVGLVSTLALGCAAPSPDEQVVRHDARARIAGADLDLAPAPRAGDLVAWECVPGYWWGYWTWASTPCAWLDPVYVEHTLGAVAQAPALGADTSQATEPVRLASFPQARSTCSSEAECADRSRDVDG